MRNSVRLFSWTDNEKGDILTASNKLLGAVARILEVVGLLMEGESGKWEAFLEIFYPQNLSAENPAIFSGPLKLYSVRLALQPQAPA